MRRVDASRYQALAEFGDNCWRKLLVVANEYPPPSESEWDECLCLCCPAGLVHDHDIVSSVGERVSPIRADAHTRGANEIDVTGRAFPLGLLRSFFFPCDGLVF